MFKFDFKVDDTDLDDEEVFEEKVGTSGSEKKKAPVVDIYESEEIFPPTNIHENLDVYKANSFDVIAGDITIRYVKSGCLLQTFDDKSTKDIMEAEHSHSDLIPGVYEGGAKIWECTDDLISFMSMHYPREKLEHKRVLDLGCGSGVLGIYAYSCGAVVHFQDYNQDVLEKITIPNVLLNTPESIVSDLKTVKFYSGDWSKYTELTKSDEKFDIILTSETIYNPENQQKLIDTLDEKLKENGIILLASKNYYFGVGGGVRQFEDQMKNDKRFETKVVWRSAEGLSREILEIKRLTRGL